MANERLRAVMLSRGLDEEALAAQVEVDVKTVERWINKGRTPQPRNRRRVAAVLREDDRYLWEDAIDDEQQLAIGRAELLAFYPQRSLVPSELWLDFFGRAKAEVGVLVHAGGFLAENARFHRLLREKTAAGVQVRILLGDPDSPEVLRRGEEERLGDGVAYKVRNALESYRPVIGTPGIEFRLHRSTLHNSLYRSDDEWLVNTQIYGVSAPQTPVLHLKRIPGADLAASYQESFESVWVEATPLDRRVAS
jgi:transcriptional regulator with XRE-family HTH domain